MITIVEVAQIVVFMFFLFINSYTFLLRSFFLVCDQAVIIFRLIGKLVHLGARPKGRAL